MDIVIASLLGLLVVVQVARLVLAAGAERRDAPAIDQYVGHRVALHMRDSGPSLRGTLTEPAPDAHRLANAEHLGEQGRVTALEGLQLVPRDRVEWFQLLAPPGDR